LRIEQLHAGMLVEQPKGLVLGSVAIEQQQLCVRVSVLMHVLRWYGLVRSALTFVFAFMAARKKMMLLRSEQPRKAARALESPSSCSHFAARLTALASSLYVTGSNLPCKFPKGWMYEWILLGNSVAVQSTTSVRRREPQRSSDNFIFRGCEPEVVCSPGKNINFATSNEHHESCRYRRHPGIACSLPSSTLLFACRSAGDVITLQCSLAPSSIMRCRARILLL
jgi:hypothetical protein